jgi:hypothetical protein
MTRALGSRYRGARHRGVRHAMIAVIALLMPLAIGSTSRASAEQKPVAELNQQTWKIAEGLLPDEFLNRYKNGEWRHFIYEAPEGTHFGDDDWIAAGPANAGKYALGADGQVVDVATGKQPASIYGPPFPDIDPKDPQAGTKCVWNFFYQSYLLGNSRNFVTLDWVGSKGMERRMSTDVYQKYFDGQPAKYLPKDNPQNFLFQQLTSVTAPADLQGTVAMTHRFRDPTQRDQVWTYVPALRRTRAVSPANRSDGFLGSDMSQDDGSYFDGKPEDFTWKLVGPGEILVLVDRQGLLEEKHSLRQLPGGGTEGTDSLRPRFAYQLGNGNMEGVAWRPLDTEFVLVKRPVWIVEGIPEDRYYLYGKIVLRFDRETWRGTYTSKYDWQGQILNSYLPIHSRTFDIGGEWRGYAAAQFTMAQNFRMNRATVSYADPKNPRYQSRISYPDGFFNIDNIMRHGK